MNKFQFPYQRIIEIKEKEKEQAQLQMAKALRRQQRVEMHMEALSKELNFVEKELETKPFNVISIRELNHYSNYKTYITERLVNTKKEHMLAKKIVDKKQEELSEKLKEEKKWNRLKENRKIQHATQVRQQEQIEMDEIASSSFHRLSALRGEEIGGN